MQGGACSLTLSPRVLFSEGADPREYATYLATRPREWEAAAIQALLSVADGETPIHVAHLSDVHRRVEGTLLNALTHRKTHALSLLQPGTHPTGEGGGQGGDCGDVSPLSDLRRGGSACG